MPLNISAEVAAPGAMPWLITRNLAVGGYRPPPGAIPLNREMVETNHCFGLSDAPGEVEVEGEGSASVGPDTIRFHSIGDRMWARTLPDTPIKAAWVLMSDEAIDAALSEFGGSGNRSGRPFERSFVPGALPDIAALRLFFRRVERGASTLWAEESALCLLARLLPRNAPSPAAKSASATQRRLVRDADAWIARNFADPISLGGIARLLQVTPAHLARSYRAVTGRSMHARLTALRMACAMNRLAEAAPDLTGLALDLGYASHSHFTEAFRRKVGIPPSVFRAACGV
jgi:AraC-like DNA-binding protein